MHPGINAQMHDIQAKEEEQLDKEVLARKQSKYIDDKRMEMQVQAKDDREQRSGEDNYT